MVALFNAVTKARANQAEAETSGKGTAAGESRLFVYSSNKEEEKKRTAGGAATDLHIYHTIDMMIVTNA